MSLEGYSYTVYKMIGFNTGQSSAGPISVAVLASGKVFPPLNMIGILAIAWEWLIMLALTFWIGRLVIEYVVYNREEKSSSLLILSRKRVQLLEWLCLTILVIGEIVTLILRAAQVTQSLNGNTLDLAILGQILFQSIYGLLWFVRLILIFGLQGLLWWTTNRQRLAAPTGKQAHLDFTLVLLIVAGLILLTYALSEQDAQLTAQLHTYAVVLDWFSLAAQCIWFGGLAYFGYVLLPLLSLIEPDRRAGILTFLLRRFYPLMLVAICVLFASELYLTTVSLSNIKQFITETYGRTLLVKWILILIMIIFSAYAFFVLYRKPVRQATLLPLVNAEAPVQHIRQPGLNQTTRSLRQVFSIQSWLAVAVLFCTALISFFATPIVFSNTNSSQHVLTGNVPTGTPPDTLPTQTKQVGSLSVMLTVTPSKIDVANTVIVRLTDVRSGKPLTSARIEISTNMVVMDMGTVRATMTGGTPAYKATFAPYITFSMSGVWDIKLTIQLPEQTSLKVVFTVLFISGA